jgi:hypothetical protein
VVAETPDIGTKTAQSVLNQLRGLGHTNAMRRDGRLGAEFDQLVQEAVPIRIDVGLKTVHDSPLYKWCGKPLLATQSLGVETKPKPAELHSGLEKPLR